MKHELADLLRQFRAGSLSEAEVRTRYARLTNADDGAEDRRASQPSIPAAPAAAATGATCRRVVVAGPGAIDDLRIVEAPLGEPADRRVHVETVAFSLNFGDLLCLKGLYPTMPAYPFTPGFEASGIVRAVGAHVTRCAIGDEVIVTASDALGIQSTVIDADESQLVRKPASLPFEEAAGLLTVGLTAVEVFRRLRLAKQETVLVQSATGGTGLTSVQLAQHAGARIIATASSRRKLEYLRSIGVEHVINYRTHDFADEVMAITGGRGVDAVINSLGGDALQKGINCLATGGRYVEIAMTGLKSARAVDLSRMSNNQSLHCVDLRRLLMGDPAYGVGLAEELFSLVKQRVIRVVVGKTFGFDELRDAYRYIEDRQNIGKVVVTVPRQAAHDRIARAAAAPQPAAAAPATTDRRIAIVGMSGRVGSTASLDEFWQCLAEGRSLITDVPDGRKALFATLDATTIQATAMPRQWGSYLEDIDAFDPLFFNISGAEAQCMDPQQRLFLEECWKALEDAGLSRHELDGSRTDVIAGVVDDKYGTYVRRDEGGHSFWGTASSIVPARIAYFLNLKGPALAIDTACSSSLVAVHLGCQRLYHGDADMVLAGGVFIQATPHFGAAAGKAQMLSGDGKCYAFDDRANGMVSGEAVAVVVMKRLDDAVAHGDHIYGVIVGSGVNQDGATNGITAPSAASQQRLELEVYRKGGIDPSGIQYVEAHGTGTTLGDPIEVEALTKAFRQFTDKRQYCALGSVKTNVGHTVTAAGVVGLVKILLAMQHRQLPATLNFDRANRHIDFESSPFYVNASLAPWTVEAGARRRAALSSFGFSGTNAHIVVEEFVDERPAPRRPAGEPVVVPLSAHGDERLRACAERLLSFVDGRLAPAAADGPADLLDAMACTLQCGRAAFSHRVAFVVDDLASLSARLTQYLAGERDVDGCYRGVVKRTRGQSPEAGDLTVPGGDRRATARALASGWVQGAPIDWSVLRGDRPPRFISLPTYPFAQERHWAGVSDRRASKTRRADERRPHDARPGLGALLDDLAAHKLDVHAAARQARALIKGEHRNGLH